MISIFDHLLRTLKKQSNNSGEAEKLRKREMSLKIRINNHLFGISKYKRLSSPNISNFNLFKLINYKKTQKYTKYNKKYIDQKNNLRIE